MGLKEAICVLTFFFFLRGCYDFLKQNEANKCQMTYMFEYPQYVEVPLKEVIQRRFSKYGLYIYGEGQYANSLSHGALSGTPVLFIPGNAGSYKQVRSIGSVLLRMAESTGSKIHFNVFTIDFNEELSGLYGGVLNAQTDFVVECVKHILSLYKQKNIMRDRVILYGHSMGGLIARAVFTHSEFNHKSVNTIFNLATPNLSPVITGDRYMYDFYAKVNSFWKANISADGGGIDHVSLISISGGDRDIIVRSDLAMINRLFQNKNTNANLVSVVVTSVPETWLSTDHLCIIWCKQLVMATARLLFDMSHKALPIEKINEIINYHIMKKTAKSKHYPQNLLAPINSFEFLANGFWRERNDKTWIFFRKLVVKHSHILVPLLKDSEMIMVTGLNIPKDDWVFACKASLAADGRTKMCSEADNLSYKTELLMPYEGYSRRRVQLSVYDLKMNGYSHVMVYSSLTNNMVEVIGERYPITRRHINFQISSGLDFVFGPQIILYSTAPKATFYNISLVGLNSLWQAYSIKINSQGCQNTCKEAGRGFVQFIVPWAKDLRQTTLSCNESTEMSVKLLVPRSEYDENLSALLLLHLDPECSYRVSIQVSFSEVMSQIARFYATLLPSYIVANLLLGLSAQFSRLASSGPCPDFLSCLASCSPLNLILVPSFFSFLLQPTGPLEPFVSLSSLYVDDVYLKSMALSFFGLRLLLFMISYGAVFITTWMLTFLVIFWSNIFRWIKSSNMMLIYIKDPLTRIKKKWDVSLPSERQLYRLRKFPVMVSCTVIALTYSTCGAFSLLISLAILFIVLCNKCCDNRALANRIGPHHASTHWNLYLTLFQLWMWICLINIPSLIHWFKNLDVSLKLSPDPALSSAVICGISLISLLQFGVPTDHSPSYNVPAVTTYIASIITTLYGLVNFFRIPFIISSIFIIFCIQQIATITLMKKNLTLKED